MWKKLKYKLNTQWIACRLITSRKSVQYGVRFSYPVYMLIVLIGVFLRNPYILLLAAVIAFFGKILPMHPLDYVYNYGVIKLFGANKIPGRGSELQVNSMVALVFCLVVSALIFFGIQINYSILAIIYLLSSIFFLCIFLFRKDSHLTS